MHKAPSTSSLSETDWRLNRFLARAGFGSRRSSEELILKGSVVINGSVCRDLARRVSSEDDVRVNGRMIHQPSLRYLLLHKPPGYVCTRSDRFAERTIFDLLPMEAATLFHVGRLDKDSEGLLLLTNDGTLAQQLLHPSRGIDKEYEVLLDQPFTVKAAAALKKGTWIDGAVARIESVHQFAPDKIKLVLHQGIKRQIRVMLGQLGFNVKRLIRTRIGPLKLRNLNSGSYRALLPQELEALRAATATLKIARKEAKKERFKKPIKVGAYKERSLFSSSLEKPKSSLAPRAKSSSSSYATRGRSTAVVRSSEGRPTGPRRESAASSRKVRGRPSSTVRTASPRTMLRAKRAGAPVPKRARKS